MARPHRFNLPTNVVLLAALGAALVGAAPVGAALPQEDTPPAGLSLGGASLSAAEWTSIQDAIRQAVYPLTVDPLLHTQVAKLTASDTATYDYFGFSVAISGDTLVVGAEGKASGTGATYVFERDEGGAWSQVKKLTASDGAVGDYFGDSVAISGDMLVVGAQHNAFDTGAAYVFERDEGGTNAWGQVKKLTASDGAVSDNFGFSVALSGDTLVVGAYGQSGRGAAYVFERDEGGTNAWGQVKKLTASDGALDDNFGASVALSGDTLVVGAYGKSSFTGAAYVFERDEGGTNAWGQAAKLAVSDAATNDRFGFSVALSGGTLVVGSHGESSFTGAAYVFARDVGGVNAWGQVAKLTASDGTVGDLFGFSVALSGDTLAAGAWGKTSYKGAAYVFELAEPPADVAIAKHVAPASAAPGQAITFTLVYSNAGGGTVTGVIITDAIPPEVLDTGITSSGAVITPAEGERYAWSVADLAPGEGGAITITGVLSEPLAAQAIANTAAITATPDADPANNQASADVEVQAVAPVAGDDSYTTAEDTPLGVDAPGVLGNDGDANGDLLAAVLDSNVATGTLALQGDGSFVYTPSLNFNGDVTFAYHAYDGSADSATVPVTITIEAVDDPPTSADSAITTAEDADAALAVSDFPFSDVDTGDSLQAVRVVSLPVTGTLYVDADGDGAVGVDEAVSALDDVSVDDITAGYFKFKPAADGNGTPYASFTFRVCDAVDCSDAYIMSVNVTAVNDPPDAHDDVAITTYEDTPVVIDVLANDGDVDGALVPASVNVPSGQGPAHGSTEVDPASGVITYTPQVGWTGTVSFTYQVCDDGTPLPAECSTAFVEVSVEEAADLMVSKSVDLPSAVPGQDSINYTVVVTNAGPSAVTAATLEDTLPAELDSPTWTCTGSACPSGSGSGSLDETLDLAAGDVVIYVISGTLKASATSLSNTASITSPMDDPDASNNEAAVITTVTPQADLAIDKRLAWSERAGRPITYTIVVTNLGPSDALGALVNDAFPAEVSDVTWECAGADGATCGTASGGGDIVDQAVDLPVGGTVTYVAVGTADTSGPIVNHASVAPPSGVPDPVMGNNAASAHTFCKNYLPLIYRH
jgi:uncharacterized repeat protein (TIGR01451 family)